jgi:hypothetical protein
MQQRRYRPGDVVDDYCPRERRITDHAVVAMIDDRIKQTRCVVCDAEHEYKDGKVPPQRRKKPQAALFSQVLDGLSGPHRPTRVAAQDAIDDAERLPDDGELHEASEPAAAPAEAMAERDTNEPAPVEVLTSDADRETPAAESPAPPRDEGPWRRQLIRAALPRPEGQQPPATRPAPEFTIRQPNTARGPRHARRRSGSFGAQSSNGNHGPMRFGRSGQGQGPGQGQGGRRRRGRGGKKNH